MKDAALLTAGLLSSWGKALLLATFGASLIQAMRGEKDLTECFERLALAVVFFTFYQAWAVGLDHLSEELTGQLRRYTDEQNLRAVILQGLEKASNSPYPNGDRGLNIPAIVGQVWRTGVWGILDQVVEFVFLTVDILVQCAREVLWKLSVTLFPLGCGVFPILPRIMTNMSLYLVELALWGPLLCIVRSTAGAVAKPYISKEGSMGLYIVGVELVACVLILAVPAVTHRLMSGAFAGDFNTSGSVLAMGRKFLTTMKGGALK